MYSCLLILVPGLEKESHTQQGALAAVYQLHCVATAGRMAGSPGQCSGSEQYKSSLTNQWSPLVAPKPVILL